MGNRPTDWHILDLDRDPVPGDPYEVKELARKLGDFADDVSSALRSVRGLSGNNAVQDWAGLAADAYREQFGDLPGELTKLEKSYRLASGALETYWPKLETAQADADRALAQGRTARQDLDAAKTTQTNANDWVKRAGDKSKEYQADPKPGVEPPSAEEVRTATRNALDASNAQNSANSAVHDAQQRLDAAKELAAQAAHLRDTAASTAEHGLHEASDAGIKNKHWWEKAVDWVADHWDEIVAVCKVIVAVLGIVVMIIGGPLAWIVLAAALVVLADTVIKYAQGKASLWDVFFAALDCIPGFKGLTTAGGLLKMAKNLPKLMKGMGSHLGDLAGGLRKGAAWMRKSGVTMFKRNKCGDPIDVATGEMVMSATDVRLPGNLPLVLERHHVSSYRAGRWFGKSWASTLDQRLILDDQGVRYTSEDGMVLYYPVPAPRTPRMPSEGPRWPLEWDGFPGGQIRIDRPETGHTLHFAAVTRSAEMPLVAITDRNGDRIRLEYSADGSPTAIVHDGGYHLGIETDQGRITALRLLSGADPTLLLRYSYDTEGNLGGITNSSGLPLAFHYDSHGRITGWQDRNDTSYRYTYDDQGRCVHTTGTGGYLEYHYVYDAVARTTVATDSLGNASTYQFNEHFQLVRLTDPLGNATLTEWDRHDRLISRTDPLGRTTHYTYDIAGNLLRVTRPDGSTGTAKYNSLHLPVTVTQPGGALWQREYDDSGNMRRIRDPLGATTDYEYGERGDLTSITDPLGAVRRITTDRAGLPTVVIDPSDCATRYERDAMGRVISVIDASGGTTRFTWSLEGHLTSCTGPGGTVESWQRDPEGNQLQYVDALGELTRFESAPFDTLAARVESDGSRTEFRYDTELRLTSVHNSAGLQWHYEYDPAGRLVREIDFNGREMSYGYDNAGQLTSRTNGVGQVTHFRYDQLGRAVEKRHDGGVTTFAHDPAGQLVRATNAHADLSFERDSLGRITAETCNDRTLTVVHDLLGRRTKRTTPAGVSSEWSYDPNSRPAELRLAGHPLVFTFDAAGHETRRSLSGGAVLSQDWDSAHRMVQQTITGAGDATGPVQQRSFTFRPDDQIIAVDDLTQDPRQFDLGPGGRVTAIRSHTRPESYRYDSVGNVTDTSWAGQPEGVSGTRTAVGTLIRRAGRTRYEHDGQGRVIRRVQHLLSGGSHVWTFTWDADDRLTEATQPNGSRWQYRYDPLGRRIAKRRTTPEGAAAEHIEFSWDGLRLAERTEANSTTTWEWEPDGRRPLAQFDQAEVDRRFYSIVSDAVGTPTELIDTAGDIAWQRQASLWGAPFEQETGEADCRLRFPGQYADDETGLHYNFHRYYDPHSAQYQSPDPLGLTPAPNPHGYVVNPLSWSDPLGLVPCTVYRVDTRHPDDIFRIGFEPRGTNMNLEEHVAGVSGTWTEASGFISTTSSHAYAVTRSAGSRYVYKIRDAAGGIDVNARIPGNTMAHEREIAFPGHVDPSHIEGCWHPDGTWVDNPGFGGGS
ncbi:DUF6531 domain-containing protein [Streptomyces fildesensis]|uniref:DUF6531 domain-containing protein n=1 Tax=Streptomyces fildesensis TaxID=375757 RepID=UPI0034D767B9